VYNAIMRCVNEDAGHVIINEEFYARFNIQEFEELEGGVVVFASLYRELPGADICTERYKVIVEAPNFFERLLGITLEDKIRKAVKKIKGGCVNFIKRSNLSQRYFDFSVLSPKMFSFVI